MPNETDTSPKNKNMSPNAALAERLLAKIVRTPRVEESAESRVKRTAARDVMHEWLQELLGQDAEFTVTAPDHDAGTHSAHDAEEKYVWHDKLDQPSYFGMEVRIPFPHGDFRCLGIVQCDPNGLDPRDPVLVYNARLGAARISTLQALANFAGEAGVLGPKAPIDR